jgi:hypothetical protein
LTFEEYDTKQKQAISALESEPMGKLMLEIGGDALRMIADRIIKRGENAEGGQFPPYSTKPMLSGCSNFINKTSCTQFIGSKTKQKKARKRSEYERYLAAESGEFETKWITIKKGGKNVHLFEIPGGYKQFRELNGRQTQWVDFSFSGDMWRDISIISDTSEHNSGVVRIGAKRAENDDKLEGNTKRKGEILKLSNEEITFLEDSFDVGLQQIFTQAGL